jgi:type IV pilus assembly protein PilV
MKSSPMNRYRQAGSSLVEVLVAILLLSFGMLALGAMVSYTVQMPKLSGYRATAVNQASNHIERMRANLDGFSNRSYVKVSSYDGSLTKLSINSTEPCKYPLCDMSTLAMMDFEEMKVAVRAELPAGGLLMLRAPNILSPTEGNL